MPDDTFYIWICHVNYTLKGIPPTHPSCDILKANFMNNVQHYEEIHSLVCYVTGSLVCGAQ